MYKSVVYATIGFIAGALAGGAVAGYFFKKSYEKRLDDEVRSVEAAFDRVYGYSSKSEEKNDKPSNVEEDSIIKRTVDTSKTDYTVYYSTETDESNTDSKDISPEQDDVRSGEIPYVIDDQEYFDDANFTKIELLYFDDGIITDTDFDPVEDLVKIIPKDSLTEFVNSDEDTIYTRCDARKCVYAIEKQDETWEGYVERHPIIKETSYT